MTWNITLPLRSKSVYLHPGRFQSSVDGKEIELTFSEFKTLYVLMTRPHWVFTPDQIMEKVSGEDSLATDGSIRTRMVGLRRKIRNPDLIRTVKGIGYKFVEDVNVEEEEPYLV